MIGKHYLKANIQKFTDKTKKVITAFFGEVGKITEYVESYIYPEYYHEDCAKDLNVNIEIIENVWELTDKPDLIKETLKIKVPEAGIFKK